MNFANNKKAFHNYAIEEKIVAGIELQGTEVKSIRKGNVQLAEAFVGFQNGEAFLMQAHIAHFDYGNINNHELVRPRKLLLHKKEIERLEQKVKVDRVNIVPIKLFSKNRWIKIELGIGKGKKKADKRQSIKEKEVKRDLDRAKRTYR